MIDFLGKGWDGSYLSHGSACHESYLVPWEEVLFLNEKNKNQYRKQIISNLEYSNLRNQRINDLVKNMHLSLEQCQQLIPPHYSSMKNEYFEEIFNQVILPMYTCKNLQRYYKEYIPIVQIENGKIVVPEIILADRLNYKAMIENEQER